jgi:PhnB protein
MHVNPYLFFNGRCEEAIHYYEQHLGARINAKMRYKEAPPGDAPGPAPNGEHIMFSCINIGDTAVMASDDCVHTDVTHQGFSLSLTADNADEANRAFGALADGGEVRMPLSETFFSPCFGMVVDRFGISWMVMVPQPQQA